MLLLSSRPEHQEGEQIHCHCKAGTQARLLLMCVLNSIKPLSLKPGVCFSFFPAASWGAHWGTHINTVHITLFVQVGLSRIIKMYKSVYLLSLFGWNWIDTQPFYLWCSLGAQVVFKKSCKLLFLCLLDWTYCLTQQIKITAVYI